MYDYVHDKEFLNRARKFCSSLMWELVDRLHKKGINSQPRLVGSGERHLIMRNGNGPIDFDYNLVILGCNDWDNCKWIKDTVRSEFDKVLKKYNCGYCADSTSVLTTDPIYFKDDSEIEFSIDVCIVTQESDGTWLRLVNHKGALVSSGNYVWERLPDSSDIKERAMVIKQNGGWQEFRERYKDRKNMYLQRGDQNHPSFVCYIEVVNEMFYAMFSD